MDGELDESGAVGVCAAWRRDASCREDWQVYHMISDVLRAPDFLPEAQRDAAFLRAFQARLAAEPVVLAPTRTTDAAVDSRVPLQSALVQQPAQSDPRAHPLVRRRMLRRWAAPLGVAAGVAMVAGVVLSSRTESPAITSWWQPNAASAPMATTAPSAGEEALAAAEWDRYLRAHREYPGAATTLSPAAGYLRNASYESGTR